MAEDASCDLSFGGKRFAKLCIWFSACILAASALFKLISAAGRARILSEPDPIFGMRNQQMFFWLGFLELAVAFVLVFSRNLRLQLVLIAALSTNFLFYRAGLWWLATPRPCPCLGNAAAWVHLAPKTLELVTKGAMVCLLAASYGPLALLLWRESSAPSIKTGALNEG